MSVNENNPVLLCQDTMVRLDNDMILSDGKVIPAGTLVLLLPQTVSECVLTPDGESLAAIWSSISRTGHTHPEIVAFSEQLIRYSDRLAAVEAALSATKENTGKTNQ